MFRVRTTLILLLLAGSVAGLMPSEAVAVTKESDWLVTLKTEELKGVLDYKGSKYKHPVKVHVSYLETVKPEDQTVQYEDFWYSAEGKPLGQERLCKYDIRPAEQITVKVKYENDDAPTQKEMNAAANAALRFYVDSTLHKGQVSAIRVPKQSFDGVEQALEKQNFTPFDLPPADEVGSTVQTTTIFLTSEPKGQTKYMRFNK